MVIMFEPIVRDETLADRLPPESWVFIAEVRNYIETRLRPLQDEIDKEEDNAGDDNAPCTMVRFNPGAIGFLGYSKELRKKMDESFDNDNLQRDVELIWAKFDAVIKGWFN